MEIIERFISEKISSYEEPEKLGKVLSRGETVGLSKKKYHFSLLIALTGKSIVEVSKKIGTSYGMGRRWNTEDVVKDQVKTNQKEFAEYYLLFLLDCIEKIFQGKYEPYQDLTFAIRDSKGFIGQLWSYLDKEFKLQKKRFAEYFPTLVDKKFDAELQEKMKTEISDFMKNEYREISSRKMTKDNKDKLENIVNIFANST